MVERVVLDTGEELASCSAFTYLTLDELHHMRSQPEFGEREETWAGCDGAMGHAGPHVSQVHAAPGFRVWWLLWSPTQRSLAEWPGCEYDDPTRGEDWFCHLHAGHEGEAPLYERDPDAWNRHLAEGNARQARKRVSADVLLRDSTGRVVIVEPKYKPDWDLPGGMAEANEPPHEAARRELLEELGLDVPVGLALVVDWVPPHGPWDDQLAFVFDGGTLAAEVVEQLRPRDHELASIGLYSPTEAAALLRPRVARRMLAALEALADGRPRYLVDGCPPNP